MILVDWEITDAFDGVVDNWFASLGDIGFFVIDVRYNLDYSLMLTENSFI